VILGITFKTPRNVFDKHNKLLIFQVTNILYAMCRVNIFLTEKAAEIHVKPKDNRLIMT